MTEREILSELKSRLDFMTGLYGKVKAHSEYEVDIAGIRYKFFKREDCICLCYWNDGINDWDILEVIGNGSEFISYTLHWYNYAMKRG